MAELEEEMPEYPFLMKTSVQLAILLLLTCFTFFTNLGALEPTLMEARNFITAREITQNHNWLIPTMNGELRLAKPPLPTWVTALAGMSAGDMYNMAALRFPAAAMAGLTVLFLFLLARQLTKDPLVPFLAAAVLLTSYLFVHLGRQATWDVYCHCFMLGAIWLYVKGCNRQGSQYGLFTWCGILLGLSFMSKGPVSFYALLLPFLLSYGYGYGKGTFKTKWRGMLLALAVGTVVAALWPLYVYLVEPERLQLNVAKESTAWVSRHLKPLWFYWTFPGEAGVWTLFTFVALLAPYARPRIQRYGNYRFLASWVLASVVLLSLIPEKKERYLLPLLLPMALLTAHYLKYLLDAFRAGKSTKWDYRILLVNGVIIALAVFAVPFVLYYFAFRTNAVTVAEQVAVTLLFIVVGLALVWMIRNKALYIFLLTTVGLHVVLLLLLIPLYERITSPDKAYYGLQEVRKLKELQPLPFYSVDGMKPESVWEVGKEVDTVLVVNNQLQLPKTLPAVIFSVNPLPAAVAPAREVLFRKLRLYNYSRKSPGLKYHMYIVSEKSPPKSS